MQNKPHRRLLLILGGAAILVGALFLLAWASKKAQNGSAQQAASADAMFSQAGGEPAGNVQNFFTIVTPPGGGSSPNSSNGGPSNGPMPPQPVPGTRPIPAIAASARAAGPVLLRPRVNPSATAVASSAGNTAAHASAPLMLLHASSKKGPMPPTPAPGKGPMPPRRAPGARKRVPPPSAPPVNKSA